MSSFKLILSLFLDWNIYEGAELSGSSIEEFDNVENLGIIDTFINLSIIGIKMARHNDLGVQDHVLVSTIFQNRQYDFLHLLELEINVDSKDLNHTL